MSEISFDLLIIGSGPGGYVAAIRAAQLGLGKIAIIEKEHVGGICLNWGCIPTKALLKVSELYKSMKKAKQFGINCTLGDLDMKTAVQYSRNVVAKLTSGVNGLIRKNRISLIEGYASIVSHDEVSVKHVDGTSQLVKAKNIIIATGARAKSLPFLKVDHKTILDYKDAMTLDKVPGSMLIIGSGAIGVEYASFYSSVGSKVTILEKADRILLSVDHTIAAHMHGLLKKQGIDIFCGVDIKDVKINQGAVTVTYLSPESDQVDKKIERTAEFEKVLIAVGVTPNTDNIGLEKVGVRCASNGCIEIDEYMRTNVDGVYAIGDVTTTPFLAHKASHQGIICVEKMANHHANPIDYSNIPSCIYSNPEVASVGYTEDEALSLGYEINIGVFPHLGNGKAIAIDALEGMTKVIFDKKTGELLGAHLVGPGVTEMIYGIVVAKSLETTQEEMIHSIYPHPTVSESIHEACLAAYKRPLHM